MTLHRTLGRPILLLALLLTLLLMLAACGGTPSASAPSAPTTPPTPPTAAAADDPAATAEQALTALAAKDEATLTKLFDASVGNLANPLAYEAIERWRALTSPPPASASLTSVAIGPAQSHVTQPPETSGTTARVVVLITHERGSSRWTFTLTQGAQGWGLNKITGEVTEKR